MEERRIRACSFGGRCCRHVSVAVAVMLSTLLALPGQTATTQPHYYGHPAVEDSHGVIAPWYSGLNGQVDCRIRIAAETLKRYPWADSVKAVAPAPEFVYSSNWSISSDGAITIPPLGNWMNGDNAQRAALVLNSLVDYYRYSGDPATLGRIALQANVMLDYWQTSADHDWPTFLISVPVKGVPYGRSDPAGMIQLDMVAQCGIGLIRAYELIGDQRWLNAAKHWGDVFAAERKSVAGQSPWGRYANPESTSMSNKQTGGVIWIVEMMDELIRLGYTGEGNAIVASRDAGRAYIRDYLLPKWTVDETFGRHYWDWEQPTQAGHVSQDICSYMIQNQDYFPNWRNDFRNIMSLFINRSSPDPSSSSDTFSGAWAYPESSSCCGRSNWYTPMELAWSYGQYAAATGSEWAEEIARRQEILGTYDYDLNGMVQDNIDGGEIVTREWFCITHVAPLRHLLVTMKYMPELFGANRENHIMGSSAVVNHVVYGRGSIRYSTFDAPVNTTDVLRLAFTPSHVTANGQQLGLRTDLSANGYTTKALPNGDCIVNIRHDGLTSIVVTGDDPQSVVDDPALTYEGNWQVLTQANAYGLLCHVSTVAGSAARYTFNGNQVRLVGSVAADGGLADVYVDGVKQLVGLDFWSPYPKQQQILYYRNGLPDGEHELRIVARGARNLVSGGDRVYVDAVQWSAATGDCGFGSGGGPTDTQRMIFGYPGRTDYADSEGHAWRPGTEFICRLGSNVDTVARAWWETPVTETITGTADPLLYSYGVHAHEFVVNVTVGPGNYHVRLKFAATRIPDTRTNCVDIDIAGVRRVTGLDVSSTAGRVNRAVDLVFNDITPRNGVIDIRLHGGLPEDTAAQAFIQAIEVGPGNGGTGAHPITVTQGNLLVNPGFDEGCPSRIGSADPTGAEYGWLWTLEPGACLRSEQDTTLSPHFVRSAPDALQQSADYGGGQTAIACQVVNAAPNRRYTAGTFVRGVGEFGALPGDSAGVWVRELAADGSVVLDHGLLGITGYTPEWVNRELSFTSRPDTAQIWYGLKTSIGCKYDTGRVVFDDCYLQIPSTLSGTVTRGGLLLAGATVTVGDKSVTTSANGRYAISGLSASSVTVTFTRPGCRATTTTLVLAPGGNTLDVEMSDSLLENPGFEDGVTIYSGTGSGGGKGWLYTMTYGDNAVRPETYYDTDAFRPDFHGGVQACRFRTSLGGGAGIISQEVDVQPGTLYQASTWVRAYGTFGTDPKDKAGLWIQELDASGNVVRDDGQALVTGANNAYEYKAMTFTTAATTARVRFNLISVVVEHYAAAAVTYDDCDLRPQGAATLSGIVTCEDEPVEGAAVSAQGRSALTGADGSYTITGLTNSTCTVTCSKQGYEAVTRTVTPSPGSNTLDIEMPPPGLGNLLSNPGFEDGVAYCSGSTIGGGYGWSYWMDSGHAIRPETFYSADAFPSQFHAGQEALRFRCNLGGGESRIYQYASVLPGRDYTASAWVRGYSSGQGFGYDTGDLAGVAIEEYDAGGSLIANDGEAVIRAANSGYQLVSMSFTTRANTTRVRFILHTVTASSYATGAVAYDDCSLLGPYAVASLAGTVTCLGVPLAGATVAVQGKTAATDGAGQYAISDLRATTAEAQASKPRYWPSATQLELASGSNAADFALAPFAVTNVLQNGGFEQGVVTFSGSGSSAGGHGWSYQWIEGTNTSRPESYYDGIDVDRMPTREYHSGGEAIRFSGSGSSDGIIYQMAAVQPGTHYTASAWVRGCDVKGQGFGHDPRDRAGIWIKTMDGAGNVLDDIGEVFITGSTDGYRYISKAFSTGPAAQVLFALHTLIAADYSECSVSFDDCALEPFWSFARLPDLKAAAEGTPSLVAGKVVTAGLNGFFYIEEPDRSSGIKVIGTASAGDVVSVRGRIETVNGERTLISTPAGVSSVPGGTIPAPFGMTNFSAGALIATGLYATVWGEVLSVDAASNSFTITDGSGTVLKVHGSPGTAGYVTVIGAIGAELAIGERSPVVHGVSIQKENQ